MSLATYMLIGLAVDAAITVADWPERRWHIDPLRACCWPLTLLIVAVLLAAASWATLQRRMLGH